MSYTVFFVLVFFAKYTRFVKFVLYDVNNLLKKIVGNDTIPGMENV